MAAPLPAPRAPLPGMLASPHVARQSPYYGSSPRGPYRSPSPPYSYYEDEWYAYATSPYAGSDGGDSSASEYLVNAFVDPFSLADDAVYCPVSLECLASEHGVPEDDLRELLAAPFEPQVPRTRTWSGSSSSGADDYFSPPPRHHHANHHHTPRAPRASPSAVRIVNPSTRKEVDLRKAGAKYARC